MGLLNHIPIIGKRQTSPRKVAAATVTMTDRRRAARYSPGDITIREHMQLLSGYIGIAATLNAQTLAGCELKLYRRAGSKEGSGRAPGRKAMRWLEDPRMVGKAAQYANAGEVEEVTDHPVLDVFRDPTPFGQASVFRELRHLQAQLCGNAFEHIYHADGRPWLVNMLAQHVTVVPDDNAVLSYFYGRDSSVVQEFPADEVLHFKLRLNPYDPWLGTSPAVLVRMEHEAYLSNLESENARWVNETRPDFIVQMADGSDIESARQKFEEMHRGARNAGRGLFTTGTSVTFDSIAPKDMEYSEGRLWIKNTVSNAYGVPVSMLDLTLASLGSAEAGNSQYMMQTILPILRKEAEWLTERLLGQEYGIAPGDMWFAPDQIVEEDEASLSLRLVSETSGGIRTVNEARSELGLEPIKGGDELRVGGQTFESLDTQPTAGVFGGLDPHMAARRSILSLDDAIETKAVGVPGDRPDGDGDGDREVPDGEADPNGDADDTKSLRDARGAGDVLGASDDAAGGITPGDDGAVEQPAVVVDQKSWWLDPELELEAEAASC